MSEGENQSKDIKTQVKEAWKKLRALRSEKPSVSDTEPKAHHVRILPPNIRILKEDSSSPIPEHPLIQAINNPKAATRFIDTLRHPYYYENRDTASGSVLYSREFGTEIDPGTGYFNTVSVVRAAFERYKLPLAIYDGGDHHARLVLGSPKTDGGITVIPVWDPMKGEITQIQDSEPSKLNSRLFANPTAQEELNSGKYDLTYINDASLSRYKDSLLLSGKFARLQYDYKNCVPYCLFVGAMLQALKPGETPFKTQGLPKFQEDFGVQILKREDVTRVKVS